MVQKIAAGPMAVTRRMILLAALSGLAGCTVQPLYSSAPGATISPAQAALASVDVKPVRSRVGQQVRNELLFLLHGSVEPDRAPAYIAELAISESDSAVFSTPAPDGVTQLTSQRLTLRATLTLTDASDGTVIARQNRNAVASYEETRQQFANRRAKLDAENRAARELAAQLQAAIIASLPAI